MSLPLGLLIIIPFVSSSSSVNISPLPPSGNDNLQNSQKISVVTNPTGATCVFERQGQAIGAVTDTPNFLVVRKSKYDITVKCNKPGYQEAAYLNHSGTSATIAANVAADLILTAGLSSIIDSADGADNKYDSVVNISLIPNASP